MSAYKKYPAYKDSGVPWLGEVPQGWGIKPLKRLSSCNDDVLPESTDPETEIEYVDISGVSAANGVEKTGSMRFHAAPSRARRKVRAGDVIISTVRTYLKAIAPITKALEHVVVSTGFAVIRAKDGFEPSFARYALHANYFMDQVVAKSVGVSYPAINASDLTSIQVAVPNPSEQTAIAAFLDRETAKIDRLIAAQRRLIDLLREKRSALISHAVTKGLNPDAPMKDSGVEWLGEVPEHWKIERLKRSIFAFKNGVWGDDAKGNEYDIPCVRVADFDRNKLCVRLNDPTIRNVVESERNGRILAQGDLLIEKSGGGETQPVGFVVIYDETTPAVCSNFVARVVVATGMSPSYWRYAHAAAYAVRLNTRSIKQTSGIQNLDTSQYFDERAGFPPPIEQTAIAAFLDRETAKIDALIAKTEKAIELAQERRSALISAAVTGKIDVRDASMQSPVDQETAPV